MNQLTLSETFTQITKHLEQKQSEYAKDVFKVFKTTQLLTIKSQAIEFFSKIDTFLETRGFTDMGGYPVFIVFEDGTVGSYEGIVEYLAEVVQESFEWDNSPVSAIEINYEDESLYCDFTNKLIPCAYPSDDNDKDETK